MACGPLQTICKIFGGVKQEHSDGPVSASGKSQKRTAKDQKDLSKLQTPKRLRLPKSPEARYFERYDEVLLDNATLLGSDHGLRDYERFRQYYFRNGKTATLAASSLLGMEHKSVTLNPGHPLFDLFLKGGVDLSGKTLDYLVTPQGSSLSNRGFVRESPVEGGPSELVALVEEFPTDGKDITFMDGIASPAQKHGFLYNQEKEWNALLLNELSHDIQNRYFPELFSSYELPEDIATRTFGKHKLQFTSSQQLGEFLSDTPSWKEGSLYRMFGMIDYDEESFFYNDHYEFSRQTQLRTMKRILEDRGEENPEKIISNIISLAKTRDGFRPENSDLPPRDAVFSEAANYFNSSHFPVIAKEFEDTAIEVINAIRPYYKD